MTDCIFCRIIKGEIPAKKAYEDKKIIAFYDIAPKAPVHVLVLPKQHISSLIGIRKEDKELLGELLVKLSSIAKDLELDKEGYKVVVNNGRASGQLVFHLHFHLLGGWERPASGWKV